MNRSTLLLALVALCAPLAACDSGGDDDLPAGDVPAELVGSWFEGTLSSIQFYDSQTGSWAPTNGTGSFITFYADGTYREGGIINVTTYGCTSQLYVDLRGTAIVEGNTITLHQRGGKSLGTVCGGETYERVLGSETKSFGWQHGTDAGGYEAFVLTDDAGALYAHYRRWN